jgi:hypothetical protein
MQAMADASLANAYLKGMPSTPANNLTGTNLGGFRLPRLDAPEADAARLPGGCSRFRIGNAIDEQTSRDVRAATDGAPRGAPFSRVGFRPMEPADADT